MKEKNKKYKAGYRIHFDRLRSMYGDAETIRTHKFKFIVPDTGRGNLCEKFEEVSKIVDNTNRKSLTWFLIQLYGLGFLFVSKEGAKRKLLNKLYQKSDDLSYSSQYANYIKNEEILLEFVTKTPRDVVKKMENNHLPQSIISTFGKIFGIEEKISANNLGNFEIIKKCHDELRDIAIKENGLSEKSLQQFFGISIDKKDTEGTTFVIQEIELEELKNNIKKINDDGFNIYEVYFKYLSKASQITKYDVASLAGVADNQNALANLFNKTLNSFQKSEEDCARLLKYGNEEYFDNNGEALQILARAVHNLSKTIPSAKEKDFFANNWADYRSLVGGRLQGWLSNFGNRIVSFCEVLKDGGKHDEVFKFIDKNCDWRNLFSTIAKNDFEKLSELRGELYSSLQSLKGENEQNSKRDFGSLIDEYGAYLQSLREFLMQWNNEGIPQEINGKAVEFISSKETSDNFWVNKDQICEKNSTKNEDESELKEGRKHKWTLKAVPQELDLYPRFIGQAKENVTEKIIAASKEICQLGLAGMKFAKDVRNLNNDNKISNFNQEKWLDKNSNHHGMMRKNLEIIKDLAVRWGEKIEESETYKFVSKFASNVVEIKDSSRVINKIYLSGYERTKYQGNLTVNPILFHEYLQEFEDHFDLKNIANENDLRKWLKLENGSSNQYSSERAEILKIYLALLLRDLNDEVHLPKFKEEYKIFLNTSLPSLILEGEKLKSEAAIANTRRFLQACISTKIRGSIALLSRKDFIERNVLQTTNGGQSCLRYVAREWGYDDLDKKSYEKILRRAKRKKRELKSSFSPQALEILARAGIDTTKSNKEIAQEIWKKFSSNNFEEQKKLTKVLGEIPHRFEVVIILKQKVQGLEALEDGALLIEKSESTEIFQLCVKKHSKEFLYSFAIDTSVFQKQFLEKFLWQDKDNMLHASLSGASIIIEKTKDVKWNADLTLPKLLNNKKIEFYLALPFKITKAVVDKTKYGRVLTDDFAIKNSQGKIQRQVRKEDKLLGIDLGEYGFGWAVFDVVQEKFINSGFQRIPLLKKMRVEAANWKDSQAKGIFSRPKTYLAQIREQAAGQTRNQIHRIALEYNAAIVYEREVDGFESGSQRISKLYKTLKVTDVINAKSSPADATMRKRFWGDNYAVNANEIDAAKTSQTCRNCGGCATADVEEKISVLTKDQKSLKEELQKKRENIKKNQRKENPQEKDRGSDALFICYYCNKESDADAQAAKNIVLKFFFKISDKFEKERKEFFDKNKFMTTKFFLYKSKEAGNIYY